MNKIRPLPLSLIFMFCIGIFSVNTRADSFDDAVNQFLKGFEYCKEAKSHLSGNRVKQAQASLQQYQRQLTEATRTNKDILTTSKRGMDGNLKFCQRVTRDVEVDVGMPTMNKALAECDAAQQALKDEKPDQAKIHHTQFLTLKDEALNLAPSLSDIFTVKNQISRCERIENKIASYSKQQQALVLALENAQEESVAYAASCQKTLDTLKAEKIDDPVLRDANQGLNSALSHKKNVRDENLAYKAFEENPQHPVKKIIDTNLAKGDRCTTELNSVIARKKQELDEVKSLFARYNDQLGGANASCQKSRNTAAGATSQADYERAKNDYESAQKTGNSIRDALSKDSRYGAYQGREDVVKIERQMQSLNQCLGETKTQLGAVFAKLAPGKPISVPVAAAAVATSAAVTIATPPPAQTTASGSAQTVARSLKGSIKMMNLPPEFALFYMPDGTKPQTPEIVVERTGFEYQLYIAANNSSLTFKNKDNTSHRISVSNDITRFSDNVARLQPRQTKSGNVNWPENSIVSLRSDRGTFSASYIANIPSANYLQLKFDGRDQLDMKFNNDSGATTAYLIMPDTDTLTFTLNKGETKSLAITRSGVPVGSLVVSGE